MHGPAGRRTEITHSASEGVRRRMWSGLWVTLLLAILGFLVIYPVLMLLLGASAGARRPGPATPVPAPPTQR